MKTHMRHTLALLAEGALALGCGGGKSPTTATVKVVPVEASSRAAHLEGDGAFTFVASAMPEPLAVDGDLSEWKTAGARGSARSVRVALDGKKLALAVTFPDASKGSGSVVIALSSSIPFVPDVGWTQRGGSTHELTDERCRFEQISLPEAYWKDGDPQPPEVVEACRGILKRYDEMVAKFNERFVRRFRVSAKSVEILDAAGATSAIPEARLRSAGDAIEVELPLSAMPQIGEAPLLSLRIAAAEKKLPAKLEPPTKDHDAGWSEVALPSPVSFEPHGALREAIFKNRKESFVLDQLSFHPSKPETIDIIYPSSGVTVGGKSPPDRTVVLETAQPIFTKVEDWGDITIGMARAHGQFLVTYRKGALVAFEPFVDVRATKKRNDHLHVIGYDPAGFTWSVGTYVPPRWRVYAVTAGGMLVDLADEGVDWVGSWTAWENPPEATADPEFTKLELRGTRNGKPKTVTWRWQEKDEKYVSSVSPKSQAATP